MRENRRLQTLLARVVAFGAAPTPAEPSLRAPPPERRADGTAVMALLRWAADHLEADDYLEAKLSQHLCCPGYGSFESLPELVRRSWDLATVHEALTEVGSWAEHTFDDL